jgi:hypothetical protein
MTVVPSSFPTCPAATRRAKYPYSTFFLSSLKLPYPAPFSPGLGFVRSGRGRKHVQELYKLQVYPASDRTAVLVDAGGCSVEVQVGRRRRQAIVQ